MEGKTITINVEEVAEKMEEFGYAPKEDVEDGWSYSIVDALEDMVDLETKLGKVFKKKYPNITIVITGFYLCYHILKMN